MTDHAHLVPNGALRASEAFNIPAVAICGHVSHPAAQDDALPTCPECKARADATLEQAADDTRETADRAHVERFHEYRVTGMGYRSSTGQKRTESSSAVAVPPLDEEEAVELMESLRKSRGGVIEHRWVADTPWQPYDAQETGQ